MRLDKYLSSLGTRSEIKKILKTGIIAVNGVTVKKGDIKIDESTDIVTANGERVLYQEFVYLIMNKPAGYVSAVWDKYQPVVVDLLPEEYRRFEPYPVGRLDIDTEGLLIITNDGELTHNLTSPKKDVTKTYFAKCDLPFENKDIDTFSKPMDLGDFISKPAKLELGGNPCEAYITVSEGKFHQVKRMCKKCGKTVEYLRRISIGSLNLPADLALGEVRELTRDELIRQIFPT